MFEEGIKRGGYFVGRSTNRTIHTQMADVRAATIVNYVSSHGYRHVFRVGTEELGTWHLGFLYSRKLPIAKEIDWALARLLEFQYTRSCLFHITVELYCFTFRLVSSGIVKELLGNQLWHFERRERDFYRSQMAEGDKPILLSHLIGVAFILAVGLVLCLGAFGVEMMLNKKPKYQQHHHHSRKESLNEISSPAEEE